MNRDIEGMKQRILDEYERLDLDSEFSFSCHPGITCFNDCCGDVNIALTPYDVLRLKKRLGMTSGEFIRQHTIRPFTQDQQLPVLLLKMREDEEHKPCPFVAGQGCTVYEDRPWPCRMYPVGEASARTEKDPSGPHFYFIMREDKCGGLSEHKEWTVRRWMDNQGVAPYNAAGEQFKQINLHPYFLKGGELRPQQMEMYFTALYDLDKFRTIVFESTFLDRFEVDEELQQKLRLDDEALLEFGIRWLRQSLFNEGTIKPRPEAVAKVKARLDAQRGKESEQ